MLRSLPVKPEKRKWTKLCMATDWRLHAVGILNVLPNLFPRAAHKFQVQVPMAASSEHLGDPDIAQEYSWHQLKGSRYRKYNDALQSKAFLSILIVVSIVLEPGRYIMRWYLRRSSSV